MVNVFINDKPIEVEAGCTILQACEEANIFIPRFCYHERLSIAGNCRMCLVEVEKSPKPIASCAMPVMEGMKIYTNTALVKKARESVLEFLLVNHPLDCPICDQGGECDLQDQALIYGSDRGRFYEYKRGVEDKNCGPLIKTIMTRCIHCTRCVRFASEIAGVEILGTTGRGRDTEIGTYVEQTFDSELSGNVIDLCPVGALTSKPYAFTARSWELRSIESIDVLDALGSNIRIDTRGSDIMRILPRLNEDINEEWISDKARFSYDGLRRQRLSTPMIRQASEDGTKTNQLVETDWPTVLNYLKTYFKDNNITGKDLQGIVGPLADAEAMLALKLLFSQLGADSNSIDSRFDNIKINNVDCRDNYVNQASLVDLEHVDLCLLVGVNPRKEAPLLNLRLRKNFLRNNLLVASIGTPLNLTYHVQHLGNNVSTLLSILSGEHGFSKYLKQSTNPVVIVGNHILQRKDGNAIFEQLSHACNENNIKLNILHTAASRVAAFDLGLINHQTQLNNNQTKKVYYVLNADDVKYDIPKDAFIIYQGHHGDTMAKYANVILPGATYTEKNATYINLEGRLQRTKFAFLPPLKAREDWKIIKALSEVLPNNNYSSNKKARKSLVLISNTWNGVTEVYSTIIKSQAKSLQACNNLAQIRDLLNDYLPYTPGYLYSNTFNSFKLLGRSKNKEIIYNTPLSTYIDNFYMTDPITRSSKIMAKCVKKPLSNFSF